MMSANIKPGSEFLSQCREASVRQIRTEPDQMLCDVIKSEGQQRQLLSLTKSFCLLGNL